MKALKKLLKSFTYAFCGIWYCIRFCRNFRIHTVAAGVAFYFSRFYNFTPEKYGVLFLTICLVMSLECINTSIESVCDLVTKEYSPLIKIAKDVAAGAVLCSAIFAVLVAVTLFWDKAVFVSIYTYFSSVHRLIILAITVLLALVYIFCEDIFKYEKK